MKTLIASALMFASFFASAHEVNTKEVDGLPIYDVAELYSVVGEERSAFVKRVSVTFKNYTAETGHEVCGLIGVLKNGADGVNPTFSIKVVTLKSQVACGSDEILDGYMSMDTTVHSHPEKRIVRLTAIDMKARGTPAGKLRTENLNNCEFSNQDYAAAGYLITCGKVFYQTGRGTAKEI